MEGDRAAPYVLEAVRRATGLALDQIDIRLRAPMHHQANRIYEARANGRRIVAKEFPGPTKVMDLVTNIGRCS